MLAETTAPQTWARVMAHLPEYRSAVLTGLDTQGYPYSVRCHPRPDAASQVLRISAAPGALIEPGPAGLLCHRHDERLWHQASFLVRGALARDGAAWAFRPTEYVEGMGYGGMLAMVRFVVGARGRAASYLAKRGLPRPSIPWDEVIAAKHEAQRRIQLTAPAMRQLETVHPLLVAAAALGALGIGSLLLVLLLGRRNHGR
jgi:hypothetical protein